MLEFIIAIAAARRDPVSILQPFAQSVGLRLNAFGIVVAAALAAQKQLAIHR